MYHTITVWNIIPYIAYNSVPSPMGEVPSLVSWFLCQNVVHPDFFHLVVDSAALLGDVAQTAAYPRAAISARYGPDLLDSYRVVAELGSAHEGSLCSLFHRKSPAIHNLEARARWYREGRIRVHHNKRVVGCFFVEVLATLLTAIPEPFKESCMCCGCGKHLISSSVCTTFSTMIPEQGSYCGLTQYYWGLQSTKEGKREPNPRCHLFAHPCLRVSLRDMHIPPCVDTPSGQKNSP